MTPDLEGVLLVVLKPVVQQHTQRHDAAVKLAVLGGPVWVDEDGGLVGEDVASLAPLPLRLLLPFPLFLLTKEGRRRFERREGAGSVDNARARDG